MEIVGTSTDQQKTKSDQVSVDVNKLAKSMRAEMENLPPFSDQCCIYRVPVRLRELNEKAYTPQLVSIGPLHHGKEELKAMEVHKVLYFQDFLKCSKASLEELIKVVEERETRLRNCYAEPINLSSEEFAKMMLLDAAFIIVVILKDSLEEFKGTNDRLYFKPWMISDVMLEMCLIENQLPFFILEDLFKASDIASCGDVDGDEDGSMIKFTYEFFKDGWNSLLTEGILGEIKSSEVAHFVDLVIKCQKPSEPYAPKALDFINVPCVTELHQAGVKFKLSQSKSLLDMKFDKGILEIPVLRVQDSTEIYLRNLQAFEQCHCREDYIANYISMINFLVISPKDVEILVENRIIENWIHDNEAVSTVLHNISKENSLSEDDFVFASLVEDLNAYCKRPWNKWKATLKQDYFNTPWAIISLIVAVILLILTVIQAVCSILQL